MAQEFFDVVEVGIGPDHFAGAGPAEGVRGDVDIEPSLLGIGMKPTSDSVVRQWISMMIKEDF